MNQTELRFTDKTRTLQFKLPRKPDVVRIKKREQIAGRNLSALVTSRGDATILLAHCKHTVSISRQHIGRAIGRAIIYDDHFSRSQRLTERAFNRLAQKLSVVIRWNDNRYREH